MILGETEGDRVVQQPAVLAQHPAEPPPADREIVEAVGVHPLEKDGRVGAVQLELPERRAVVDAGRGPAGERLARDRRRHVLPGARKEARPPVARARLEHHRPGGLDPVGERGTPGGQQDLAGVLARDRPEAHRRVRRPVGRRADRARALRERIGQDADRVDVAELALVGPHARRRVTLHVLHGAEALLRGEPDVRGGHVVLQVDERPRATPGRGDLPARLDGERRIPRAFGNVRRGRDETERDARLRPGPPALLQGGPQAERAVARPGASLRLDAVAGHEAAVNLVVPGTPPRLRVQVDARAPAPGAEHEVAVDAPAPARPAGRRDERSPDGPGLRPRPTTACPPSTSTPRAASSATSASGRMHPDVREHRHLDSRLDQLRDDAIGGAVVGDRDRPVPGTHPVAAHERERRGREHHPRAVVVGEHQRALGRAGGQHHAPRPHLPQAFVDPRPLRGELHDGEQVVVVVAGDGGSLETHHAGEGIELRRHARRPLGRGAPADLRRGVEQRPSRHRPFVGEHHPGAAARRGQRGLEPGRSRPRHQHVAVVEALLVRVPAGGRGRGPEARHAAHERAVEVPPAGEPHERLVVEPRGKQRREPVGDRAQVEADARPAVDAARAQALGELEGRRPRVGLVRVAVELNDGVPGSSAPAATIPRGRWYLKLRPTRRTPLAIRAEARVSPGWPS